MSDEKIVPFTGPRQAPTTKDVEEMIERVETIIERIRNGEVVAIAYTLIWDNGYTTGAHRLPGVHSRQVATAAFGLALDAWQNEE